MDEDKIEPIAVVGLSFGFPAGATTSEAFWKLMMEKRNVSQDFPKSRLDVDQIYHPDPSRRGQIPVRGGHFLAEDIAEFDAPFFSITPDEAAVMDPQQRGLLEHTYLALENAGLPMEKVSGTKTSVYTGCFTNDWQHIQFKDTEQCGTTLALGAQPCVNANRISWCFNFTGNSCNVDTACSSSLVCLDMGCTGLLARDTEMSIVAGCNLIFSPDMMHSLCSMNMLSPTSMSYSFDSRANGYSRGEGFGVLVLKRLSDALRDGNTIQAVIRATGCNQDGNTPGITMPSPVSQEALIRDTYQKAGLSMLPTRYFEAHGTGTPVGDPIESAALGGAFRRTRTPEDPLIVGAVKSNIGHLEGAAGIAGVIKAVLVLQRAVIPPNTNFEKLNPKIDVEYLRIKLPLEAMPWPTKGLRRASVNSFGFGGTNAHVVMDDAFHFLKEHFLVGNHTTVEDPPTLDEILRKWPASGSSLKNGINGIHLSGNGTHAATTNGANGTNGDHNVEHVDGVNGNHLSNGHGGANGHKDESEPEPRLLMFSSFDDKGTSRQANQLSSYFADNRDSARVAKEERATYLENLAFTLNFRRSSLPWKSFAVVNSLNDLPNLKTLMAPAQRGLAEPTLGVIFTGQGAQWAGMGRELVAYPLFARRLLEAEECLKQLGCPWNVRAELFRPADSQINRPNFSQPLCTALQVALVDLLASFGVYPTAVTGHSSGEIAAAYSAGAISAGDAWKIAYFRGVCAARISESQTAKKGAMMAVGLSEASAQPYIDRVAQQSGGKRGLTVACINSPKNVTISGDVEQVDVLQEMLERESIFARKLLVDVAYHSAHMDQVADEYRSLLKDIGRRPPHNHDMNKRKVVVISSVTGDIIPAAELAKPDYWVANMVSPVRFVDAVGHLFSKSSRRIRKKLDLSHKSHFHITSLLEVGPHAALQGPIRDILTRLPNAKNIGYSSVLVRKKPARRTLLEAMGQLRCLGFPVDLAKVNYPLSLGKLPRQSRTLTDLPGYPFDHSKKYWYERRLGKSYRTHPQNKWDLLGKPVHDWNPLEAKWRNVIRVSEMPWVEDHVINGSLVYPGAGMLVMAIEAARQLADTSRTVVGYEVKDCIFQRALAIPQDADGAEVQLTLRASPDSLDTHRSWSAFRLCVYENGGWHECCHGHVRVDYETKLGDVTGDREKREQLLAAQVLDDVFSEVCDVKFDPAALYRCLQDSGFGFGPSFQPILSGQVGPECKSRAEIKLFEWPESQYPQEHVVHPTSLDGILHLSIAGVAEGGRKAGGVPTMIPTRLRKLWLSSKGLFHTPETPSVTACAWMAGQDNRGWEFDCSVLSCPDRGEVLATFEGLRLTIVSDNSAESAEDDAAVGSKQTCYNLAYKPDADIVLASSGTTMKLGDEGYGSLVEYIDAIGHKNPGLSVLEIDCDGDGTTIGETILGVLAGVDGNPARYSQFTYAAVSDDAVQAAKDGGLGQFSKVSFQTVDLDKDLVSQGLSAGGYDVVVVNGPAKDAYPGLELVRKLLSAPSGWLITVQDASEGPANLLVGVDASNATLDFVSDIPGLNKQKRVILARQEAPQSPTPPTGQRRISHVAFVIDTSSTTQQALAKTLQLRLSGDGLEFSVTSLDQAASTAEKDGVIVVVLLEIDTPFLYRLSEQQYPALQSLLMHGKETLWVNRGGGKDVVDPEYAIINGIARVVRNEYDENSLTVLQLDVPDSGRPSESQIDMITTVLRKNHLAVADNDTLTAPAEPEYVEISGRLNIPRVLQNADIGQNILVRSLTRQSTTLAVKDAPPLRLTVGTPGLLDTLHFIQDKAPAELKPGEIEIRTHAVGMNFKDCLIALGQVPGTTLGIECSGVVTRTGSDEPDLKVGDRVLCVAPIATYARCHASAACKIPDSMSFEEAAAIPAQFGTAWEVVHELARLRKGETILVHAAAGGTGQAAIQIAQYIGGTVFATVGSNDKKKVLMEEYGIPEDHIFYSRDTSFAKGVMRMTGGRGVDVVVNSLFGESLVASWQCVAAYGRFVEIGKRDIMANSNLPMFPFAKNASFIGFDATTWHKERPVEARRDLKRLVRLFEDGVLHTARPLNVYDIGEAENVFRLMQDGKTPGKMVMRVTPESRVKATLETKASFLLEEDATYVIAGGLGGLGRSMARWMVGRNAKNLVLLSRSGPRTEQAREFLAELRGQGVRVEAPPCDVTSLQAMKKVFEVDLKDMPPIKGCIQGSMVRRDELLENLSFEGYQVGATCKTIGSWNLHTVLPPGMDFFILLSSASGLVGLRGQTNYNAGNTYEDALARYRVSRGEKAISLDLGAMIDDGLLAETPELLKRVLVYGALNPVTRQQFYAILDYFCDPARPVATPQESQVVIGLGTGGGTGLDAVDLGKYPILRHMAVEAVNNNGGGASGGGGGDDIVNYAELIGASPTLVDAGNIIAEALVKRLSKSLSAMEGVEVDLHKPLHSYGVDSLLAIELRKWIAKEFKADVAVFEVVGGSTFSTLAVLAAGRSGIAHPAWHI
ncbi:putative polyketide synthase [Apodospora peruviana]|uniref:Polyketide synthase n=1 Tax=Apodospora peruviana TaxID=516989 RepID=A0AAE0IB95_9PEZI|nr:putative polyketide synthase [Apodospora peruviana]